jgi:hypothetical protein
VIEGEREWHHPTDDDLPRSSHRFILNPSHTEDAHLRIIEDRRAVRATDDTVVGDGEGAPLELGEINRPRLCFLDQLTDLLGQIQDTFFILMLEDKDLQPLQCVDGNTDMVRFL